MCIRDSAQLTPATSPSSGNSSPLALDANDNSANDKELDEDDTVSSSSDAGIPRVSNVQSVLHLPWGSSPIPGPSGLSRRGREEISVHKEIKGTECIGRHAFSARNPTPDRQFRPMRSSTACNSPATNSDIASWQVSQRVSRTQGPHGFITNRELSVSGSSFSVNDAGNAVALHDGHQLASNSFASTPQAGPSSQGSPLPSTSRHIWAPRSPWRGSPWSNAGCLLYTSPSPRDLSTSRMPSSA